MKPMGKRKPVILFDDQIFKLQQYGGISRYFSQLIKGLNQSNNYDALPSSYFSNNKHLGATKLHKFSLLYRIGKFRWKGRLINYISKKKLEGLKKTIKAGKFDIFHPTYYKSDFLNYLPENIPFVLTVHDMIHELYFDPYFKIVNEETKQKSILIPKASHIITISESTKKDILTLFPEIDPAKISVIYHGFSFPKSNLKKSSTIKSSYILYVGKRQYYKNFVWMLESLSDFLKEQDFLLICAGGGDFTDLENELIIKNNLKFKVLFYDIPNDDFLNELYSNAFCFIFPSLYEGFGLPILEAFSNNCPVILSIASCFPEIAGNAALYFEVDKPLSLTNQLTVLLNDNHLRNDLINMANQRLKKFSWDKMVDQHEKVYRSIING